MLGAVYYVMTAFTASGTLATDLQGAKLVALFPGIPLPLPSANVQDTAGNQTLDLTVTAGSEGIRSPSPCRVAR